MMNIIQILVVAGGADKNYDDVKTTEVLKLGDTEWKAAADLPYNLRAMASISWAKTNSVFFIGLLHQYTLSCGRGKGTKMLVKLLRLDSISYLYGYMSEVRLLYCFYV